jgi:ABC-type multidrug transport system permease subunit
MKTFARIGKSIFIIGLILTIVGLILGFGFMIYDNDKWAMRFLMAVPTGFVFLFTGLATSVMFSPRDDSDLNEKRSLQDFHDDL